MGGLSFLTNNKGDKNMKSVFNRFYPLTNQTEIKYSFSKDYVDAMFFFHEKGQHVYNDSGDPRLVTVVDGKPAIIANDDAESFKSTNFLTLLTPSIYLIVKRWKHFQDVKSQQSFKQRLSKKHRKNEPSALSYQFPKMPDEDMFLLTDKKVIEILTRKFEYLNSIKPTSHISSPEDIERHCETALHQHQTWKIHTKKMRSCQSKIDDYDYQITNLRTAFEHHAEKYLRLSCELGNPNDLDLNDLSNYIDISEYDIEELSL